MQVHAPTHCTAAARVNLPYETCKILKQPKASAETKDFRFCDSPLTCSCCKSARSLPPTESMSVSYQWSPPMVCSNAWTTLCSCWKPSWPPGSLP